MSRKNTDRNLRNARKVRKSLRATPPAYIDLVEYIQVRTKCTRGMARKVLLTGSLMVDSHPVGYKWEKNPWTKKNEKVLSQYLPAHLKDKIVIQNKVATKMEPQDA